MAQNYTTGTVSVSNGGAVVTGSGTAWELSLVTGGLFCCAGYSVPIASVESDTSLTLALPWPGVNGAGESYAIFRETAQAASAVAANDRLAEVAERLRTLSFIAFDASGTLAQRATYNTAAKDFIYLRTDADPFELYIKKSAASGDWAGPNLYGQGEQGIPGPIAPFTFAAPDALAPGATPTVTNTGTATAPNLKFGIPIGEGFYWRGPYSGTADYVKDDVVRDSGSTWIALQATTGNAPPAYPVTSNAHWELVAPKGQDGLGTVTTLVAGDNVSIDNSDPKMPVISAAGDVVGPAGSVDGGIALLDGATGKIVKDGSASRGLVGALSVGGFFEQAPIHVGDRDVSNSTDAQILISRTITTGTANGHAFSDSSLFQRSTLAYNSYDARCEFGGTFSYNHYAAFQAGFAYNATGVLGNHYSFISVPIFNSGTVTRSFGFYAGDPGGGGVIATNYGIYVAPQTRGNVNWGVYVEGASTESFFEGTVLMGSGNFRANAGYISSMPIGQESGALSEGSSIGRPGNASGFMRNNTVMIVGRPSGDGNLINFYEGGTLEGAISVSGTTVTYGSFCGAHWSQLADGSRPDILRGTVIETIDEMCAWADEDNDQLARFKVSDTVASKAVYGIFCDWGSPNDEGNGDTNDANIAALGAFVIRVASGQTVQRGDLLESNGDGCARVQVDDLFRASTIAKVTSPTVIETYPDGSFLVPCTLHCG